MPLVQHAFAGALASIAATVTYAPIDKHKKVSSVFCIKFVNNYFSTLQGILHVRNEGFRGLYRGLISLLARETPGYFFFFAGYASSKKC